MGIHSSHFIGYSETNSDAENHQILVPTSDNLGHAIETLGEALAYWPTQDPYLLSLCCKYLCKLEDWYRLSMSLDSLNEVISIFTKQSPTIPATSLYLSV